jgi:hypothetical protein
MGMEYSAMNNLQVRSTMLLLLLLRAVCPGKCSRLDGLRG